jgi:hypothetical protein
MIDYDWPISVFHSIDLIVDYIDQFLLLISEQMILVFVVV